MNDNSVPPMLDNQLSKEDFLILKAKEALSVDIYTAKSWLITAKSLFPHSSKIQFEAYKLEKVAKNVKEAAQCFSQIFQNFPDDQDIWKEIESITESLRNERTDVESEFLNQMFQHLPQDLQHRLLVMTADHSEDTMEHCKLLLLLLKRFPQTVSTHGPRLVETLLTAEKHSHPGVAVNDFRKLLACDALPLLGSAPVELNARLSLRLLVKSIEFFLAYIHQTEESYITQPWDRMFEIIQLMGKKLCWELSGLFATQWNQDLYCERLLQYEAKYSGKLNDEGIVKQLLICTIAVLLRILYEHDKLINTGETTYCLVEAFANPVMSSAESKLKKRKRDESMSVVITSDGDYSGSGLALAVKLWKMLRNNDILEKELTKISPQLRLDVLLKEFIIDLTLYKGLHAKVLPKIYREHLVTYLKLACCCFFLKDYKEMLNIISIIATMLPENSGKISENLVVPGIRHLHYIALERFPILQYCCRLLLLAIKDNFNMPGGVGDYAIGHALVLMQIDWPQQANLLTSITDRILNRGAFSYPLFFTYIICIDILEEMAYLCTESGGGVFLDIDIDPEMSQNRRMSTRGADKGAREKAKQILLNNAALNDIEPMDKLILKFIVKEKTALLQSLVIT